MRYCWETLKRLISDITQLCYSCVIYVCSFIFFKKQTFGRFCKLPNASIRPCLCNCNKHHILFNTLDAVVDFPQTALNLYLKYVKTFQMSLWIRCLIWELRYHHMPFTHHPLFPALLPFINFLSLWLYLFYMRLLVNRSPRVPPQMQSHPDYLKEVISALGPVLVSNSSLSLTVTPKDFRLMCSTLWLCRERCYINKIVFSLF